MSTDDVPEIVEDVSPDDGLLLSSSRGRTMLVWGCTVAALALLLWNMPVPVLRGEYREIAKPVYEFVQLEQGWALFAPFVAQESWFVHIEVVRTDGTTEVIEFPDGDPFIGTYRAARWSTYEEELVFIEQTGDEALQWALREADDSDSIERLDLILLAAAPPTGSHGPFVSEFVRETLQSLEP